MGNHIHLACWRGDLEALDKYIGPTSNQLNILGVFGVRALHIAVFRQHKRLVQRIIMSINYEDFHATFGAEGVTAVLLAQMMSKDMASFLMWHCEILLDVRHRLRLTQDLAVGPNNSWHLPVAAYKSFKAPPLGFTKALEMARKVNRDVNCALYGCPPHFTPIFLAVLLDNVKALKMLIKEGGRPHLHPVIAEGDYRLLHLAARFDHYKIIPILVKAGCSLYEKTKTNRTPLAIAAHWGHLRSIKALADSPGFNIHSSGGDWALYAAAQQGQFHVIRTLIKLGCNADSFFQDDSPLHAAAAFNHTAVVRILLDCGANPLATSTTSEGKTPLIAAAAMGSCDVVQPLMEAIRNPDDLHSCLFSPAEVAIYSNHINFLITLFNCGFDINLVNDEGWNLLHSCILHGLCSRKILTHLIELGCDTTTTDDDGFAPIHLAASLNEPDAIKALVDGGCNINLRSNRAGSPTAVHLAAALNHIACIEVLQTLKCDLEVQLIDSTGLCPLQVAVLNKNHEACRKLVELGADIHGRSAAGLAPLHWAASKDEVDMIEELIECGSDPDVQWRVPVDVDDTRLLLLTLASPNCSVYTPLHVAVSARNVRVVKKLLELGSTVDCSSETPSTFTALHMASERGHVEIVSTLITHGADIEKTTDSLCTPLLLAVESNRPETARVLLENGCDVDHVSFCAGKPDLTPFQLACLLCHPDVVQVLIPYIKDIDKLSPDGLSPLHLALLKPYYWEPSADGKYVPFVDPSNVEQYETNQRKLIRILLDNGCNVNATDEKGVTALDLAANYDLESIVMMLVQARGERGEQIKDREELKKHIEKLENHAAMGLRRMKMEIKDLQEFRTQATAEMEALYKVNRQMHKRMEDMQTKLQRLGPSMCLSEMNDFEKFLQSIHWMFMRDAGAKEVASELRRSKVIPEQVETKIERALDRKTANGLLYDHLYAQGTFQTLEIVCDVFIGEQGYPGMNQLGERMKEEITDPNLHFVGTNLQSPVTSSSSTGVRGIRAPTLHDKPAVMKPTKDLKLVNLMPYVKELSSEGTVIAGWLDQAEDWEQIQRTPEKPDAQLVKLLLSWLQSTETEEAPHSWEFFIKVVRETGKGQLAERIQRDIFK